MTDNIRENDSSFQSWETALVNDVPKDLELEIPEAMPEEKTDDTIDKYNSDLKDVLEHAQMAVIQSYLSQELARVKRQKPLLGKVIWLTIGQCLFFNAIIAIIVWVVLKGDNPKVILELLDVIKWYITATVTEFIGMIVFVVRATFSDKHIEAMEHLLSGEKKRKNKYGDK